MSQESLQKNIEQFLNGSPHAVVGASADRGKYGNKVLRAYMQHGRAVIAVNPHEAVIEGLAAVKTLEEVGKPVHGISIITPPAVTTEIVHSAIRLGIKNIWMQPGAESDEAVDEAMDAGLNVIAGGPCILVVMGYRESWRP